MSDEPPPRTWPELVYRLSPGPIVAVLLALLLPFILVVAGRLSVEFFRDPKAFFQASPISCLDLKEVGGQVYKIDQCRGTVELLVAPQRALSVPPPTSTP